jgi:hypothetical protein
MQLTVMIASAREQDTAEYLPGSDSTVIRASAVALVDGTGHGTAASKWSARDGSSQDPADRVGFPG